MGTDFVLYVAVGFAAQLVDGAIGMAYGLSATTVLLSTGVPPAMASACVHAAKVFTGIVSGLAHWRFGNVHWQIMWRLAVPGALGGAGGAYVLTEVPGDTIRPFIAVYLLAMGGWILWRATHKRQTTTHAPKGVVPLGLGGGFIDAIGGGGWGPIVTSTLIGRGTKPRYAIGSVNMSEVFVAVVISITFFGTIGLELWSIILALVVGGALAAPLGAYSARRIPDRPLMILVGALIMLLSLRTVIQAFT